MSLNHTSGAEVGATGAWEAVAIELMSMGMGRCQWVVVAGWCWCWPTFVIETRVARREDKPLAGRTLRPYDLSKVGDRMPKVLGII